MVKIYCILIILSLSLHASILYDAIESKDYDKVDKLLSNGSDPYEYNRLMEPYHALCYVAANSDSKMLTIFLKYVKDVNDDCKTLNITPIMSAAASGNIGNMNVLLKEKANINVIQTSGIKSNVLLYAIEANQSESVKWLIEHGANINYVGLFDFNAMSIAIGKNNMSIFKLLIEKGIDLSGANAFNAMKSACINLSFDFIKILVTNSVNLNFVDSNGNTILHLLASNIVKTNLDGLKGLVQNRQKGFPSSYYDNIQQTINSIESKLKDYEKIIQYLVTNGADKSLKNKAGKTALDIAIEKNNDIVIKVLKN